MAPTSNKTINYCPKCKKRTAFAGCPTCIVCKKGYHKLCADLKYPTIPRSWKCAACTAISTTHNHSPKNEDNNSSILINNPGHSLMTIETNTSNDKDNLPEELFKMVSTRRKRKKSNVTLHNSFEPLSSIDDEDEMNHELVNTSYNETNYTNMLLYNRHNDTNSEEKFRYLEQEITNLQERLKTAEKNIDILKTENISLRLVLAQNEKTINDSGAAIVHRSSSSMPPPPPPIVRPSPPSAPPPPSSPQQPSALLAMPSTQTKNREGGGNNTAAKIDVAGSRRIKDLKPKIILFGDQQIRGIAGKIEAIRRKKDFEIFSFVKPFAKASQILDSVKNNLPMIGKYDIVILALGCNDYSPNSVLSHIDSTTSLLKNNHVFIIEIPSNLNIGSYLLNSLNKNLKDLANKYSNLKFIDMSQNYSKLGNYYSQNDLSFKINIEIDFLEYQNQFLGSIKNRSCTKSNNNIKNTNIKKGTIPYLFEQQMERNRIKSLALTCNNIPKGTIPYYFPSISKAGSNKPILGTASFSDKNNFFRV